MSQTDVGAVAEAAIEGTVDNMLHSQQAARANGPLAAGPLGGGPRTPAASAAGGTGGATVENGAGQGANAQSPHPLGSLLHRELDAAGEGSDKGTADAGTPDAGGGLALTIPPDLQNSISPEQVQVFTQYATSMGWNNAQAQAALDYQVQNGRAAQSVYERQLNQWEGTVRADPELGGKNLNSTVATANKAMQYFDPTGTISSLLKSSGHGSNPDVVRFLYKVGKALGEDRVPLAGNGQRSTRPLAERMYPNFKF